MSRQTTDRNVWNEGEEKKKHEMDDDDDDDDDDEDDDDDDDDDDEDEDEEDSDEEDDEEGKARTAQTMDLLGGFGDFDPDQQRRLGRLRLLPCTGRGHADVAVREGERRGV